jgi:hypothetical protein
MVVSKDVPRPFWKFSEVVWRVRAKRTSRMEGMSDFIEKYYKFYA